MILQALHAYYGRLLEEGKVQSRGLQEKEIHWAVEIGPDGAFVALRRLGEGKRGRKTSVPSEVKKSVNIASNLLWDNAEYVLGAPRPDLNEKQRAKVPLRHAAFIERVRSLSAEAKADSGVAAVLAFMERDGVAAVQADENFPAMIESGGNVSFRLAGDDGLVCERPALHKAAVALAEADSGARDGRAWCLITGRRSPVARLHPAIKGVHDAQTSGANIVSFNLDAFRSHGWDQGRNAPVSEEAANGYVTALNHLLARDNAASHRTEGGTTFVFWSKQKTGFENIFSALLDDTPGDVFDSIRKGIPPQGEGETPFYVLGLSPNAARLAVRFWHQGTVGEVAARFKAHFDDLEIADSGGFIKNLGLWRLLGATCRDGDVKKMQDNLRGVLAVEVVTAILKKTPYPYILLARAVERCRSERSVWPARAALIRAVLNRRIRQSSSPEREVTVSLDPANTNPGYLLGRLFAAYEDIQKGAQGNNINTTIRDRYFGAAAAAPRAAFVQLDKLKNAHIKKLRRTNMGHAVNAEKLVGSIIDKLLPADPFPAALALDDQARFIAGYHHQIQYFFNKSTTAKES